MTDYPVDTDWRLPQHRREAFQRQYSFHLKHKAHPGMVYSWLPALADHYDLDDDGRAWLVWLNGNTQNPVTSKLLLDVAPSPLDWKTAVAFWNDNFKALEWDTDRRHQKAKFGEATFTWFNRYAIAPAGGWLEAAQRGWEAVWAHSKGQPWMGRLSGWSMYEYARILLPGIPDVGSFMLEDKAGSCSHRNGLAVVAGYDATYWGPDDADMLGLVHMLDAFAEDELLPEAWERNGPHSDVSRLTMESALCTYKSWHKPNRRYPGVYADMAYQRLKRAEARWPGISFDVLWQARQRDLPPYLRLEDNPFDPGLSAAKQNWYRESGQVPVLGWQWGEMWSGFDQHVADKVYGPRKDPKW